MKYTTEMSFEEFVEWAEGHILKELIAGRLHSSVHTVVDQAVRWEQQQVINEKKSKKKKQ